jgi:epoxyqueuosine reductase
MISNLADKIKVWGLELGFQQIAITDTNILQADKRLQEWLGKGYHGTMEYLAKHRELRSNPAHLVAETKSIIIARLNYLPLNARIKETLHARQKAYISRYALGRDYHRKIRKLMEKLAQKIKQEIGEFNFRSFADSAPVFEKPLAEKAGLGWLGKNTLIINREAGSWFFLGVLYTNLELPIDESGTNHCGSCTACIDVCPTKAIVAPYVLDARRCISYLTIENKGSIPEEFRGLMGNRIFGCDDCQLICPWNKFAKNSNDDDFQPRHNLANSDLVDLFAWTEAEFELKTQGSAIRRAGYAGWLRNIAVALGNAPSSAEVVDALKKRENHPSPLVREHVAWALARHNKD